MSFEKLRMYQAAELLDAEVQCRLSDLPFQLRFAVPIAAVAVQSRL